MLYIFFVGVFSVVVAGMLFVLLIFLVVFWLRLVRKKLLGLLLCWAVRVGVNLSEDLIVLFVD